MIAFLCDNFAHISGFDQEAYRAFYKGAWDTLPLDLNWKPYWGINEAAQIIHFHGPKPAALRKLFADPNYGAPDIWRQLFASNPESYWTYLSIWEKYQQGCELPQGRSVSVQP